MHGKDGECNKFYLPHSAPRLEAGAPLADDIWKCALKPIDWKDHRVTFTEAEKMRLQEIDDLRSTIDDW